MNTLITARGSGAQHSQTMLKRRGMRNPNRKTLHSLKKPSSSRLGRVEADVDDLSNEQKALQLSAEGRYRSPRRSLQGHYNIKSWVNKQ